MAWHWHNVKVDGIQYQWQCKPYMASHFGADYISAYFPENQAKWLDSEAPETGQTIFVRIAKGGEGLLYIKGASLDKPSDSAYMKATAVTYDGDIVRFKVPFNRFYVDTGTMPNLNKITPTSSVIASIRIKNGEGVIDGIFVDGISLAEFKGTQPSYTISSDNEEMTTADTANDKISKKSEKSEKSE